MKEEEIKILIVEDDPVIRTDLKSLLKHSGFDVKATAKNGMQALDFLSKKEVNFVILDIHLGTGASGINVAEVIHQKYHIPYIFLTSFTADSILEGYSPKKVPPFRSSIDIHSLCICSISSHISNILFPIRSKVLSDIIGSSST